MKKRGRSRGFSDAEMEEEPVEEKK